MTMTMTKQYIPFHRSDLKSEKKNNDPQDAVSLKIASKLKNRSARTRKGIPGRLLSEIEQVTSQTIIRETDGDKTDIPT